MIKFLTSSFVDFQPRDEYVPRPLNDTNGFGDNLRRYWVENANFLVFTSDPENYEMTNHTVREMYDAFTLAGFSIGEIRSFDNRNSESLKEALKWADVFFLSGGHAPTENCFMKEQGLRELIINPDIFDGIFIGLSAGSLNSADTVYLIPELEGEASNPNFQRFAEGLGFTDINILPHYEYFKERRLDGLKLVDDIIAKDSFRVPIYMIYDGSYFMIRDNVTEFFGEGIIMENGVKRPLEAGIIKNNKIFEALVSQHYDWIFLLDTHSGKIETLHASDRIIKSGIVPASVECLDELNSLFAKKLVVEDEKKPYLDTNTASHMANAVNTQGAYNLTVHIDNGDGVMAESIRAHRVGGEQNRLLVTFTDISMILDHDWMTDEYSRSGFITNAQKLLADPKYSSGYSMVYTNVKGFKAANDLLGTFSGDMIIFMECEVLRRELEPVIIARLESDHFVLITETAKLTEDRLERICNQCYEKGSKRLPLLFRLGIYNIYDTNKTIQHMLDRAELTENSISARLGKPYAIYDNRMSREYVERRVIVSELDGAIEREEFEPYYQPVVDVKTGEIVSAEALIRWNHKEKGMISPGQFIPVFEKEGLITKIDSYMVDKVLSFNIDRMQKGQRVVPCAINLSRVDFYDTKLLDIIRDKLKKQKNIHDILKLEVTESAYAVLESDAISFLNEMKALGVSLMLDDFGSGMSSLSTLESFEFDVIKLDMGFISKIGRSTKSEGIIKHTIGLSHDIGAKVVAEGVETKEQYEFLKAAGCDMIQGFYFFKPMPQSEFIKYL